MPPPAAALAVVAPQLPLPAREEPDQGRRTDHQFWATRMVLVLLQYDRHQTRRCLGHSEQLHPSGAQPAVATAQPSSSAFRARQACRTAPWSAARAVPPQLVCSAQTPPGANATKWASTPDQLRSSQPQRRSPTRPAARTNASGARRQSGLRRAVPRSNRMWPARPVLPS